jgi:hypothetical protein
VGKQKGGGCHALGGGEDWAVGWLQGRCGGLGGGVCGGGGAEVDLQKLRGLDLEGMLILRVLRDYGEAGV